MYGLFGRRRKSKSRDEFDQFDKTPKLGRSTVSPCLDTWRDPMKSTTACSWAITLSLMIILSAVVGIVPAHSQSAVAPGSVGSHPGGSQETLIPPKPKGGSHPDGTK